MASLLYDAAASLMMASIVVGEVTGQANFTGVPNCTLVASHAYQEQLSSFLSGPPVKLIEMDLELNDHPPGVLKKWLKGVHKPYRWVRSLGREGQSLLMLEENYSLMSLTALSIGVVRMSFNVTERPRACLKELSPDDVMLTLRNAFFTDFTINDQSGTQATQATIGPEDHVCNMHVVDEDGYAVFRYQCCRKEKDGTVVCDEVEKKGWIKVLLALILILKIVLVMYSPMFLPESLYRLKYVACQYVYHLPEESELPLNIVVTQEPQSYGEEHQDKTVRLSRLHQMEYFKTLVSTNCWQQDRIYEVRVKDIRLSVKARRLLSRTKVPVGVFQMIYNNLCRCRIRKLEAVKFCCDTSILGRFTPTGVTMMKWSECMRLFAVFCQLVIVASPWVLRLVVYGLYEYDMLHDRLETAKGVDLPLSYSGSLVLYLTPVHAIFIVIYVIIIVDALIYGVIARTLREKLNVVIRQCLRDMRERSRMTVCGWVAKVLVIPFSVFGLLAFIVFPVYLVIIAFVLIPIVAFYVFPTVNLTLRLLIHLFIFMCPRGVSYRLHHFSNQLSGFKKRLLINEVTAKEKFVKRTYHKSTKGIILQLYTIVLCLVSFWSITLLMMEIVSFFVEVLCYTFMGVVVNAGVTLQYCTVLGLVFWHGRNSTARVRTLYQNYHKLIHDQIVAMTKEDIDSVARLAACEQENTAFRVTGAMSSLAPRLDAPKLRVKENVPQWLTPGILAFLNRHDKCYTPEKFFSSTTCLNFLGCPGPIHSNVLKALWDFAKIVLFLLFVLIIVLAFGDVYQISSTNQLLATVVGGIIPFFFSQFFQSNSGVCGFNKDSVQFQTEFHAAINEFEQAWPVYDIIPSSFKEAESNNTIDGRPVYKDSSNTTRVQSDDDASTNMKLEDTADPLFLTTAATVLHNQPNQPLLHSSFKSTTNNSNTNIHVHAAMTTNSTSNGNDKSFNYEDGNANSPTNNPNSNGNSIDKVVDGDKSSEYPDRPSFSIDIDNNTTIKTELETETNTDSSSRHGSSSNKQQSISMPLLNSSNSNSHPSSSSKYLARKAALKQESDFNTTKIDLIVDISTSKSTKSRSSLFRRKTNMESGSVSMLDYGHHNERMRRKQLEVEATEGYYQENLV